MRRRLIGVGLALFIALGCLEPVCAAPKSLNDVVAQMLDSRDYLGARVLLKRALSRKKVDPRTAFAIKRLVISHVNLIGYDLVDLVNASTAPSTLDQELEKGDALMDSRRFAEAFSVYQAVGKKLKAARPQTVETQALYPHVLHAIARALYGAGRYAEAIEVYGWIGSNYPRIRQVLFEKMWAGFRGQRTDIALGAIASQRSAYFSGFMHSESYLVQNYIYRKLCRDGAIQGVLGEMARYEQAIQKGDVEAWAKTDLDSTVLWNVAESGSGAGARAFSVQYVSAKSREAEKNAIIARLKKEFERDRPRILSDLRRAKAYTQLSSGKDRSGVLKPIQRLPDRAAYLKADLEAWPAESQEEWADEIGSHRFFGDSLCASDGS